MTLPARRDVPFFEKRCACWWRGRDHRRGADRQPQPHRHQHAHRFLEERRQPRRERQRQPRFLPAGADRISGRAGDSDTIFEAAIEAGADDVESDEDGHRIWTNIEGLHEAARALEARLGEAEGTKLAWRPATEVEVRGDDAANLIKLIDSLDEDDDVQSVWGNYDVPEEELERLAWILGLTPGWEPPAGG